jgi:ribonuclease HI
LAFITVFADASFDHVTKASGYAYWHRDGQNVHRGSGGHAELVGSSSEAECVALCIAIVSAIRTLEHRPGDVISLQSDCIHALKVLQGQIPKMTMIETTFSGWALRVMREHGLSLRPKHIKAHTGLEDARSYVNTFCDEASRRRMRHWRSLVERGKREGTWRSGAVVSR